MTWVLLICVIVITKMLYLKLLMYIYITKNFCLKLFNMHEINREIFVYVQCGKNKIWKITKNISGGWGHDLWSIYRAFNVMIKLLLLYISNIIGRMCVGIHYGWKMRELLHWCCTSNKSIEFCFKKKNKTSLLN